MKAHQHLTASFIVSGLLFVIFRSWGLSCASFVSGIIIDVDHVIDYWIMRGVHFNPRQIIDYFDNGNFKSREKIYFIFHSWELLIIVLAGAFLTEWNIWITGLLIGYSHHMVLDEIYNNAKYRLRPYVLGYCLLWRWKNKFDFRSSFPGAYAAHEQDHAGK